LDALTQNFQFIRDEEKDAEEIEKNWKIRMSVRYYQKLFREYALADLSKYQEGKIGLRWRTEMEVLHGKGQFICGNKKCEKRQDLHSYELLFGYIEQGERKRCLVKVRVCENCARKIFYKKLQYLKERQRKKQAKEKNKKKKKMTSQADEQSDGSEEEETEEYSSKNIHQLCAAINREEIQDKTGCQTKDTSNDDHETDNAWKDLLL
jgi:protein FRA10AC1